MKIRSQLKSCLILLLFLGLTAYHNPVPVDSETPVAERFIWHDLVTPDMNASSAFYKALFGWEFKVVETKGLKVGTIYSGSTAIGGVIEIPGANTSVWIKAIPVENLDARVKLVEGKGGKVLLSPARIPGRGVQVIMEGFSGEEFSFIGNPEKQFRSGAVKGEHKWLWSELWADQPESAKTFYEIVFKVSTETTAFGDNPYWIFNDGAEPLAGMIKNPITNQGTQWVPYVQENDPPAAVAKAVEAGAFVVLGPTPQVREGKVAVIQDPLGAIICLQKQ